MSDLIIGIDGGGTYTRAMLADRNGDVLSYAETGGANPHHNIDAGLNIREAINKVITNSGYKQSDVKCLVAGFAGLDSDEDKKWAETFTAVDGIVCPRLNLNDAVIAHAGALCSKPGIITISGTGSIIFAITEKGREIRNYDFHHYSSTAARYLSYNTVYKIIAGEYTEKDIDFINEVLKFWGVSGIDKLADIGSRSFLLEYNECKKRFGEMAPLVTNAALSGIPLAEDVCSTGVGEMVTGIKMLGRLFEMRDIPVALVGSVARCGFMKQELGKRLTGDAIKSYHITEPSFSPAAGAIILGYKKIYGEPDEEFLFRLKKHHKARFDE